MTLNPDFSGKTSAPFGSLGHTIKNCCKSQGFNVAAGKKRASDKIITCGNTQICFVNESYQNLNSQSLTDIVQILDMAGISSLKIGYIRRLGRFTPKMTFDDTKAKLMCINVQYHSMEIEIGYTETELSVIEMVCVLNATKFPMEEKMVRTNQKSSVDAILLKPENRDRLIMFIREVESIIKTKSNGEINRKEFTKLLQSTFQDLKDKSWTPRQVGEYMTSPIVANHNGQDVLFYKTYTSGGGSRGLKLGKLAQAWIIDEEIKNNTPQIRNNDDDCVTNITNVTSDTNVIETETQRQIEAEDPRVITTMQTIHDFQMQVASGEQASCQLEMLNIEKERWEAEAVEYQRLADEAKENAIQAAQNLVDNESALTAVKKYGEIAQTKLDAIRKQLG